MKKRIWILLILAALLLIPHVTSANAPAERRSDMLWVECSNLEPYTTIEAVLFTADGASRTAEADISRHYMDKTKATAYIRFEEGETSFYLLVTTSEGTQQTDTAEIIEYGGYLYEGMTNVLKSTGAYYDPHKDAAQWAMRIIILVLPMGITLLFEYVIAACFGITPVKYVFIINAITNPVMNVLLLAITWLIKGGATYWIALIVLELAVFGIEYWFYTWKYRSFTHKRLLLFTLVANVVSLGAGLAFQLRYF